MFNPDDYRAALDAAHQRALGWLDSVPDRPVRPQANIDTQAAVFDTALQAGPLAPEDVVTELATKAEPGLMAMGSGRFYGWVIGGTLPAALGADWLVSAWDQNAAMRLATPSTAAIEATAGRWLLDLLGLPAGSDVGFTTGATMANFMGVMAGRQTVLASAGWNVNERGLIGAPPITVLAGGEVHASMMLAFRYSGLGLPQLVEADEQGRMRPDALRAALEDVTGPVILALQAGELHSGACDPFDELIPIAKEHGAWVHVDGAFGLWAAASPRFAGATRGLADADSWATDAHKTLNVPYDCGVSIVRGQAVRPAMKIATTYLLHDDSGPADPHELVPDFSRRARGVPAWAALRSLGREGVVALVEGLVDVAQELASRLGALDGVEVVNDVVFTQVCLSFGTDERTQEVTSRLIEDGTVWMSGSRWMGRAVLRISVSNWSTDEGDIAASVEAVKRAMAPV
jgi:glutamate/tyrosine decarboxylase-like PLP-dependent enzyme